MKTLFFAIFFALALLTKVQAQKSYINIVNLHTLVENNKTEYDKQNKTRDEAAIVLANETTNRTILARAQLKFVELANRFNTLGSAIDAANIGLQASPMVNNIVKNQSELIRLCKDVPAIAILAYQSEIEFVDRSKSLVNYLIGLSASIGVINQMKMADRRVLFDFVIHELSSIETKSFRIVNMVRFYNTRDLLRSSNPFQNWIDTDKELVKDILKNYKDLKQ